MFIGCLGHGVRAAARRRGLISTIWATNLALGLLATVPAWAWWSRGFAPAPSADALLDGFNLATYLDLVHYDRSPVTLLLIANVAAVAAAASVVGALVFGGTLEILRATDGRTFMHRFLRGAGHFFGRYLRLAVYTAIAALPVIGLVSAALVPLLAPLDESAWEPGWVVAAAIRLVIIGAVVVYFLLVLDYARIRVAIDDTRRLFVAWIASLGFVLRHLAGTVGIVVAFGALVAVLLAVYVGYCSVAPMRTSVMILALAIVQQAVMWVRGAVRVARVAAEAQFFEANRPAVSAASALLPLPVSSSLPQASASEATSTATVGTSTGIAGSPSLVPREKDGQ